MLQNLLKSNVKKLLDGLVVELMESGFGIAHSIGSGRENPNHYGIWDGKVKIGDVELYKGSSGEHVILNVVDAQRHRDTIIPILDRLGEKVLGYDNIPSSSPYRFFHLRA